MRHLLLKYVGKINHKIPGFKYSVFLIYKVDIIYHQLLTWKSVIIHRALNAVLQHFLSQTLVNYGFLIIEVYQAATKKSSSLQARERTCVCTDRVFLSEVECKRLSDTVSNLRDEQSRYKIDIIDLKQEGLELKSKADHHENNAIVLAKQLTEAATK